LEHSQLAPQLLETAADRQRTAYLIGIFVARYRFFAA
jgi:hypothetical protein